MTVDEAFLDRVARGKYVTQDEYDQMSEILPPDVLAQALASRFNCTGETRMLVSAARLYLAAGRPYDTLEVCSRAPRVRELQQIVQKVLPGVQREYPGIPAIGKLMEEAFLVIDLTNGHMLRFPPLLPAISSDSPSS